MGHPRSYLGHFAQEQNLAKGHNQGMPPLSTDDNPSLNPIAAAGLASMSDRAAASIAGGAGSATKISVPRRAVGAPGMMKSLGMGGKPIKSIMGTKSKAPRGIKPNRKLSAY